MHWFVPGLVTFLHNVIVHKDLHITQTTAS